MARTRRSLVPSFLALGLVALGLPALVPTARAEDDAATLRLESLVPGTTLAFAGIEDIGAWGARAEQAPQHDLGQRRDDEAERRHGVLRAGQWPGGSRRHRALFAFR